jgi:protein SCO1/2
MTARHTRILLVFSAFLAGLVLCFAVILLVSGRFTPPVISQRVEIGGSFTLINKDGRTITEQDFKGRPFLVFFGFTHCPDVCPTALFEISEIMKALGPDGDRLAALFITVDPERDTAPVLKDYLSNFDPRVQAGTGDAKAIAEVAKKYRVYYKKVPLDQGGYTMDHTAVVYLMDKQGTFVAPFSLKRTPQAAADELRKYF